jgi:broad specificity phosphatase PhoE
MQVILVRHGQTDWNREGIFRGRIDVKLNAAGLKEAAVIGEKLRGTDPDAVCSSPLSRAMDTALRIASYRGKQVREIAEFVDIDFGVWEGLSRGKAKARYPKIFKKWEQSPERVKIPGAETLGEVRGRVLKGLDLVLAEHPEGVVVIVSHGLINKVLLCAVLGLPNSHFWKIKQDNGAINIFTYSARGTKLVLLNDTSHIKSVDQIIENNRSPENPLG